MKKVYRSLILIVFINVGGYIICNLITIYILIPITGDNQIQLLLYGIIPSVILIFASASSAPILYINRSFFNQKIHKKIFNFSSDYNNAYNKEYRLIKKCLFKLFRIKQKIITTTTVEVLPKNSSNF